MMKHRCYMTGFPSTDPVTRRLDYSHCYHVLTRIQVYTKTITVSLRDAVQLQCLLITQRLSFCLPNDDKCSYISRVLYEVWYTHVYTQCSWFTGRNFHSTNFRSFSYKNREATHMHAHYTHGPFSGVTFGNCCARTF